MITLLAATGYTGQLVAAELKRRGLSFRLAARSKAKLEALNRKLNANFEIIEADVTRPQTLAPVFDGAKILLNCAGPFIDLGEPVAREAARRGIHYLDTTGEQPFMKLVFDRYGQEAEKNGAALVPAAVYDYAFGDAGAELAARGLEPCDEITVTYRVNDFSLSRGTKKSILRAITRPGWLYREGQLIPAKAGAAKRIIEFPDGKKLSAISFGGGEVLQVPAHVQTKNVITLMAVNAQMTLAYGLAMGVSKIFKQKFTDPIIDRLHKAAIGPSDESRQTADFIIRCEAKRGSESRVLFIEGRDPYGLTAVSLAAFAERLSREEPQNVGAIAPSMLFGAEFIREFTAAAGVDWRFS